MYYLLKKDSVIKGQPMIITQSEEKILDSLMNEHVVVFEGDFLPSFIGIKNGVAVETNLYNYFERGLYKLAYGEYDTGEDIGHYNPIMEKIVNKTKVQKTNEELKLEGFLSLEDGDFVSNNSIKNIHSFEIPTGTVKPKFDYDKLKWIETATQEEIQESNLEESIRFYNSELELVSKAVAEFFCGVITEEQLSEIKAYIKYINPYKELHTIPEVKRPSVLKKYVKNYFIS